MHPSISLSFLVPHFASSLYLLSLVSLYICIVQSSTLELVSVIPQYKQDEQGGGQVTDSESEEVEDVVSNIIGSLGFGEERFTYLNVSKLNVLYSLASGASLCYLLFVQSV